MAQLLYDRHSTATCIDACCRHIRLLRQLKGTEELSSAIEPFKTSLVERRKATELAIENKTYSYDMLIFTDAGLDDSVRDLSDDCKQYDRKNPGRLVYDLVFLEGNITSIIRTKMEEEPKAVAKLIQRIESLGAEHPLAKHIPIIQGAIDSSNLAIANYLAAIDAQKTAETLEEIAKMNLMRQYEQNYYEALKKFGKVYANRMFPVINARNSNDEEENTTDTAK